MSKLPVVDARTMEQVVFHLGFEKKRQRGSHVFYRHPDRRYTTIPHHKGRQLTRPIIRTILKQIQISVEEFLAILQKI